MHRDPDYGYHPEASKKVLVVGRSDFQQASQLFAGFEIKIVSGSQFLGEFVNEDTLTVVFASSEV